MYIQNTLQKVLYSLTQKKSESETGKHIKDERSIDQITIIISSTSKSFVFQMMFLRIKKHKNFIQKTIFSIAQKIL